MQLPSPIEQSPDCSPFSNSNNQQLSFHHPMTQQRYRVSSASSDSPFHRVQSPVCAASTLLMEIKANNYGQQTPVATPITVHQGNASQNHVQEYQRHAFGHSAMAASSPGHPYSDHTSFIKKDMFDGHPLKKSVVSDERARIEFPPRFYRYQWEEHDTVVYQMDVRGFSIVRRADSGFVNGTKLLNLAVS